MAMIFVAIVSGDADSQGYRMVYFQTKNPNLGKLWRAIEWAMLVYFMVIWNILRPFGVMLW
jgi:hypothetical protein